MNTAFDLVYDDIYYCHRYIKISVANALAGWYASGAILSVGMFAGTVNGNINNVLCINLIKKWWKMS